MPIDHIQKGEATVGVQRKIKSSSEITPEKIARSPFAKMGLRMIGFIGGSMIMVIIITALVGR